MKKIKAANIQEVLASNKPSGKIFTTTVFMFYIFFISLMSSEPFVAGGIELQNHGKILPGNHGCWYWKCNKCYSHPKQCSFHFYWKMLFGELE